MSDNATQLGGSIAQDSPLPFGRGLCNHLAAMLTGLGPDAAREMQELAQPAGNSRSIMFQIGETHLRVSRCEDGPRDGQRVRLFPVLYFGNWGRHYYARGRVTIFGHGLPHTLGAAAQGRPLSSIISVPPGFTGRDSRIVRADLRDYIADFILARHRSTITLAQISGAP